MTTNDISCNSIGCVSGAIVRALFGMALMLVGGLMIVTFWLLPLGVVAALFGLVLIVGDSGEARGAARRRHSDAIEKPLPSEGAIRRMQTYVKK